MSIETCYTVISSFGGCNIFNYHFVIHCEHVCIRIFVASKTSHFRLHCDIFQWRAPNVMHACTMYFTALQILSFKSQPVSFIILECQKFLIRFMILTEFKNFWNKSNKNKFNFERIFNLLSLSTQRKNSNFEPVVKNMKIKRKKN